MFEGSINLSSKRRAILQRFLISRLLPKDYSRHLFTEYYKVKDNQERKRLMSKPFKLILEVYDDRKPVFINTRLSKDEKEYVHRFIPRDLTLLDNYINKGETTDDDELNDILGEILPSFRSNYNVYKAISPIWISKDDDIFTVMKPFPYRIAEDFEVYRSFNECIKNFIQEKEPNKHKIPLPHILQLRHPPDNLSSLIHPSTNLISYESTRSIMYESNRYMLRENMTIIITNVKLNHTGHIILEGHVDIPYREDTFLGGGYKSKGGIQISPYTTISKSIIMILSIAIISISSILPR
jgi:hypothetical protein